MRFAYTKAGEPLEELAARTYAFQGEESATQLRAAAKALRDANPFLRRLSDVPEGTLLVVPPLEEAAPAPATQPFEETAVGLVVARLKDAAEQAIELLAGELHQDVADTKSSIDVLTSAETRRLARADDQLKLVHQATEEAAKARLDAANQLGDYRKQVAKQVDADLEELLAAFKLGGA